MHFSSVFLGLVATVSAIDLYGYSPNEKCSGNHVVCQNANPDDCCVSASGNIYRSIEVREIPSDWNIIGRAYNGGGCKNELFVVQSNGRANICLGGNDYSGGKYSFASSK